MVYKHKSPNTSNLNKMMLGSAIIFTTVCSSTFANADTGGGDQTINAKCTIQVGSNGKFEWAPAVSGSAVSNGSCSSKDLSFLDDLAAGGGYDDAALQAKIKEIEDKNNQQDKDISDIKDKNNQQDKDISDIKDKNNQQDKDISDIKDKNNQQDKDISDIKDGAVFYNRDADGNKTGGVTLNDGVSKDGVQLSNVAKAKDGKDAVNLDQLRDSLGGEARTDADGNYIGPNYNIGGKDYGNVGDALKAQGALSVQYVADENGRPTNNIILTGDGTGAPVGITNVKAGTNALDAVNKSQLDGALAGLGGGAHVDNNGNVTAPTYNIGGNTYNNVGSALDATNSRIDSLAAYNKGQFDKLNGRISDVRNEARAGIAGAGALAGMRYDDRPGKLSLASGFGGFKDHQAMSIGVGYTTIDGVFRMNAGASYDFQGQGTVWNMGLGWTLN